MPRAQSAATDRALALVAAGASVAEAAEQSGVADSTIRRALRGAGIPPRKAGPRVRPEMLEALALVAGGMPAADAARRTGVTHGGLSRALVREKKMQKALA